MLVAAPLFGALVERVLMRRMWDAPLVAQLVVTIGLMLAMIGFALKVWDPSDTPSITTFFGTEGFNLGTTFIPWYRFITIVGGLVIALALRFVLYRTRLGIAMRAVVDNRELAALNGARPGRVSMFSWALGSSMAAIAGIFLAEELAQLNVEALTLLIIDAFAAAIIGRLKSLPMTYVGGLIIGLSISFQSNFLTWGGRWTSAAPAIPTIVLFIALLFIPEARIEGKRTMRAVTARVPTLRRAALGMGAMLIVVLVLAAVFDRQNIRNLDLAICTGLIMLSMVPLTGWSGQISLAQITFVGAGTFAIFKWGPDLGSATRPAHRRPVRGALRGADGPTRAASPGALSGAGVDGVRVDGGDRVLRPARGVRRVVGTRCRRSSCSGGTPVSPSVCWGSTSPPTPGCSSSPRSPSRSSGCSSSRCAAASSVGASSPCTTVRPRARRWA